MYKPLGNHILVRPFEKEGLIKVADKAKSKPTEGEILAVGSMVEEALIHELVGKTVLFKQFAADEFLVEGEILYLVEEPDVMCVYETNSQTKEEKAD